jgi:hypothetical protein
VTLAKITDDTYEVVGQQRRVLRQTQTATSVPERDRAPEFTRGDVWMEVYQYYTAKESELERSSTQVIVQVAYAPQLTLLSSQPQPNPWQHSLQATAGVNFARHAQGFAGLEHQIALQGTFFNLGSGQTDWFQNVLAQYQLSAVVPIGHDFRLGTAWGSAQASIFAQVGAGAAATWVSTPGGDRKAFVGFVFQPAVGAQVQVSIGWFQIFAQGQLVYSYMSPTAQKGSTESHSLAFQPVAGIGGQF